MNREIVSADAHTPNLFSILCNHAEPPCPSTRSAGLLPAVAGDELLVAQPEGLRVAPGGAVQPGIGDLDQVQHPGVVTEVEIAQFGVIGDAETLQDQAVEVPDEVVGEIEGAQFGLVQAGEAVGARVQLVAVDAGQALDALLGADPVEQAPRPAVHVADEDRVICRGSPPSP